MKQNTKAVIVFVIIGILVFGGVFLGLTLTKNIGKSTNQVSTENALERLEKLKSRIDISEGTPHKVPVELGTSLEETLPSIDTYPLSVNNTTSCYVEIFSSTEKSSDGNDGWLNEVAEQFNREGFEIDGERVSVAVRPIASGLAADYISTGAYTPELFSPSNELWGEMIKASGVNTTLEEKCLVPNVAGVLLSKKRYDELLSKYGAINMKTITEATAGSEIAMGYTNPFASSTGMNFLISTLCTFDDANPLSDTAISGFEAFQSNVPFVAYTTLQMRESAESGVLDGFIMEYQTYINSPDLRTSYVFTPFGVRHDSPVYSMGTLSPVQEKITEKFIEYCKTEESQKLAQKMGFSYPDSYVEEIKLPDGDTLLSAQKLWKEKKDSGRPIIAVFVADVSGSMSGEPINELKRSLLAGAEYINSDNSVGLVTYSTDVCVQLPIAKFDINQRSLFAGAVNDMDAEGSTATFDAIVVAIDLLHQAQVDNPDAKMMLFVLSDGETNVGCNLNDVKPILEGLDVPVYTIGYNADISALQRISAINEAASINASSDDVVYQLKNLFNAQM